MTKPSRKRHTDANVFAKLNADTATGRFPKPKGRTKARKATMSIADTRDPAAVSLGRRGGLKGGKARAKKLSARRRSEIASNAAKERWKGHRKTR